MQIVKGIGIIIPLCFSLAVGSYGYNQLVIEKKVKVAYTEQQVVQIYERLARNSGEQGFPALTILDSPVINAWTDGINITITTGILKVFQNDDELALVLAHEMGHYMNHDPQRGYGDITSNDTEAHADKMGAYIMMRAGFDECKGKEIMHVFKHLFGDTANPMGHPDFAYRYDQLDLPLCHKLF